MKIISKKKADISMTTIVGAAIAIMVLLVVLMIFTNNMKAPANELDGINDGRDSIVDNFDKRDVCSTCVNSASECPNGVDSLKSCRESVGTICCI